MPGRFGVLTAAAHSARRPGTREIDPSNTTPQEANVASWKDKAKDLADKAKDVADDAKDAASDAAGKVKKKVEDITSS